LARAGPDRIGPWYEPQFAQRKKGQRTKAAHEGSARKIAASGYRQVEVHAYRGDTFVSASASNAEAPVAVLLLRAGRIADGVGGVRIVDSFFGFGWRTSMTRRTPRRAS
jgi:hypothetical protein